MAGAAKMEFDDLHCHLKCQNDECRVAKNLALDFHMDFPYVFGPNFLGNRRETDFPRNFEQFSQVPQNSRKRFPEKIGRSFPFQGNHGN